MIRWFLRGVSHRKLTTRFPRAPEPAPSGFRARALLDANGGDLDQAWRCAEVCLPGALSVDERGRLRLDGSRCIGCGLCVEACGDDSLAIDTGYELATTSRGRLVVGEDAREADISPHPALGAPFRRSLHIRHVDAGSDGAIEQEIAALLNPYYDMHRLGLFFTASPRHADALLVTGPVTGPMEQPLRRAYDGMPEPRVVIAAGTDACSGSIWTEPEVRGGVDRVLPVDVYIPGDPPSPIALLHGLLLAAGRVQEASPPALPGDASASFAQARGAA
ncbi:MAG TPA: 4Fe-4S binding protein [Solirubrobacteraceae bacterium]|nr:4Fe-4S binding protein [Solirubrobacteraceae bacterium]